MTSNAQNPSGSSQIDLTPEFQDKRFRDSYLSRHLKVFLAAQIRALRGDLSQTEFGERLGKPQSVVSRLERQSYGKVNLQTLIDIASRLDIGLIVRFVNFDIFLKWTSDFSEEALKPSSYPELKQEVPKEIEEAYGHSLVHGNILIAGVNMTANTNPYFNREIIVPPPQWPSLIQVGAVPVTGPLAFFATQDPRLLQSQLDTARKENQELKIKNEVLEKQNSHLNALLYQRESSPIFGTVPWQPHEEEHEVY